MSDEVVIRPVLRNRGTHGIDPYVIRLQERLVLPVRVEGDYPGVRSVLDCLLDTACPLPMLFPRDKWVRFEPAIRWIPPDVEASLPQILRRGGGAGGGMIEYRLGVVRLTVCDLAGKVYHTVPPQLAAFALSDAVQGEPLIGLGGGILNLFSLSLDLFLQRAEMRS
jgi:hypothetical protein